MTGDAVETSFLLGIRWKMASNFTAVQKDLLSSSNFVRKETDEEVAMLGELIIQAGFLVKATIFEVGPVFSLQ